MCFALWLWPGWHCNNTTDRSWVWFLLLSILSLGEPGNQIVHDKSAVSHLELSPNHKHEGFEPTVACRDSVRICDDQRSFQSIISPMTKSLNCSLARKIRRQDHSDRHERKKISEIFLGRAFKWFCNNWRLNWASDHSEDVNVIKLTSFRSWYWSWACENYWKHKPLVAKTFKTIESKQLETCRSDGEIFSVLGVSAIGLVGGQGLPLDSMGGCWFLSSQRTVPIQKSPLQGENTWRTGDWIKFHTN